MPDAPPIGYVRLETTDPRISLQVRLSEERPNVDSGYGGWNEVTRPRRKPITTFSGPPALRMTLGLLFDKFEDGLSVEGRLFDLERMATPTATNGEPPRVKVTATGGAIPYQGKRWVITDLAWGDALMNHNGNRTRQAVTISLLEYVEDRYLVDKSAATRSRTKAKTSPGKGGASSKRVVVKRSSKKAKGARPFAAGVDDLGTGEDLATIAARELGDAERWVEIAELNGLRDPQATRPGQVIRLP